MIRGLGLKNIDFNIANKKNILASDHKNDNSIRKTLTNKIDNHTARRSKQLIFDKMKIKYKPDDSKGELNFRIQLGRYDKTFKISGFKISS